MSRVSHVLDAAMTGARCPGGLDVQRALTLNPLLLCEHEDGSGVYKPPCYAVKCSASCEKLCILNTDGGLGVVRLPPL